MYRRLEGQLQLLVAHPGGPYFRRRHESSWTIPKGMVEPGETRLDAAQREFEEETGFSGLSANYLALGEIRQRSGKHVHAWAFEGDCNPSELKSLEFELEWPPKSGRTMIFPEINELRFASPVEARRLLNPSQSVFVDRLLSVLNQE
jgi:predicted NUDIX family NTP pyrophosphohydrolase